MNKSKNKSLNPFYRENTLEVGIDEVGRGSLFGRVYVAGVILPNNLDDEYSREIRDSKKVSTKKRKILRKYIEENAIDYYVGYEEHNVIDTKNILRTTLDLMCKVVDNLKDAKLFIKDEKRKYSETNELRSINPEKQGVL